MREGRGVPQLDSEFAVVQVAESGRPIRKSQVHLPHGARCGGAARPGSLLEHRHIKALLRNDRRKSPDLDAAKKRADTQKEKEQKKVLACT